MKLRFNPSLQYQRDAISAIVNVFDGQPFVQTGAMAVQSLQIGGLFQTELGMGNRLLISDGDLVRNIDRIQEQNDIEKSPVHVRTAAIAGVMQAGLSRVGETADASILTEGLEFSIEMETGTGKTYVYLRSIFELNQVYGFKKFIIVAAEHRHPRGRPQEHRHDERTLPDAVRKGAFRPLRL